MSQKAPKRMSLPLASLQPNPKNSNVVPDDVLAKLQKNIKRTGLYPPLIVRIMPNGYQILDGHHRKIVLERLGKTEADCDVWDITDRESDVMLATLNTLRGTDDLRLRAALIDSLLQTVPIDQLAEMLPESKSGLEDLQKLTLVDLDALDIAARTAVEKADAEAPQPLSFVLYPEQFVKVRNALEHMKTAQELHGKKNADGQSLYFLCVEYLSGVGWEESEAARMENEPPIGGAAI
jgi:ParB-like chromosome segregation protein Spo0J